MKQALTNDIRDQESTVNSNNAQMHVSDDCPSVTDTGRQLGYQPKPSIENWGECGWGVNSHLGVALHACSNYPQLCKME